MQNHGNTGCRNTKLTISQFLLQKNQILIELWTFISQLKQHCTAMYPYSPTPITRSITGGKLMPIFSWPGLFPPQMLPCLAELSLQTVAAPSGLGPLPCSGGALDSLAAQTQNNANSPELPRITIIYIRPASLPGQPVPGLRPGGNAVMFAAFMSLIGFTWSGSTVMEALLNCTGGHTGLI